MWENAQKKLQKNLEVAQRIECVRYWFQTMELGIFLLNSLKKERTKKMIEEFKEC